MSENNREDDWKPFYREGRQAYIDGKSDENNPHGKGQMMKRCAWFGGWHDKRREDTK